MSTEIDDDVYHYDFTTASEWEIFIARLEELIHDWKLSTKLLESPPKANSFRNGTWSSQSEKIIFADVEFLFARIFLKHEDDSEPNANIDVEDRQPQVLQDLMSMENDFCPVIESSVTAGPHFLSRWYGLQDFLVLIPSHTQSVSSESKIKLLLSSVYISLNNTKCPLPFFVQGAEPWQKYYMGLWQGRGVRTEFDMVHLKRTPSHSKHLTGLLSLFKSKLGPLQLHSPVLVSVRFTYVLKDWTSHSWSQDPPDFDFLGGETIGVSELGRLPFGASFDPLGPIALLTTWPVLSETAVVDSESYSDLEPTQAPRWALSVSLAENPACLLTEYLTEFLQVKNNRHGSNSYKSDATTTHSISSSMSLLTDAKPGSLSQVLHKAKHKSEQQRNDGPISSDLLIVFLYYLFPDADADCNSPYPEHFYGHISGVNDDKEKTTRPADERLSHMKSAPEDSLSWRISILMAHVIHSLGGVKAASHLWYEITQELRFRVDRSILIPGLNSTENSAAYTEPCCPIRDKDKLFLLPLREN